MKPLTDWDPPALTASQTERYDRLQNPNKKPPPPPLVFSPLQLISQRHQAARVEARKSAKDKRIAELEAKVAALEAEKAGRAQETILEETQHPAESSAGNTEKPSRKFRFQLPGDPELDIVSLEHKSAESNLNTVLHEHKSAESDLDEDGLSTLTVTTPLPATAPSHLVIEEDTHKVNSKQHSSRHEVSPDVVPKLTPPSSPVPPMMPPSSPSHDIYGAGHAAWHQQRSSQDIDFFAVPPEHLTPSSSPLASEAALDAVENLSQQLSDSHVSQPLPPANSERRQGSSPIFQESSPVVKDSAAPFQGLDTVVEDSPIEEALTPSPPAAPADLLQLPRGQKRNRELSVESALSELSDIEMPTPLSTSPVPRDNIHRLCAVIPEDVPELPPGIVPLRPRKPDHGAAAPTIHEIVQLCFAILVGVNFSNRAGKIKHTDFYKQGGPFPPQGKVHIGNRWRYRPEWSSEDDSAVRVFMERCARAALKHPDYNETMGGIDKTRRVALYYYQQWSKSHDADPATKKAKALAVTLASRRTRERDLLAKDLGPFGDCAETPLLDDYDTLTALTPDLYEKNDIPDLSPVWNYYASTNGRTRVFLARHRGWVEKELSKVFLFYWVYVNVREERDTGSHARVKRLSLPRRYWTNTVPRENAISTWMIRNGVDNSGIEIRDRPLRDDTKPSIWTLAKAPDADELLKKAYNEFKRHYDVKVNNRDKVASTIRW